MNALIFAAPDGIDPTTIDLHALTAAVTALGLTLDDGVSLLSDGTFAADAEGDPAVLSGLDWSALALPPAPVETLTDLRAQLAALMARIDALLDGGSG